MDLPTFRASPTALAKFQSFVHAATFAASFRAWSETVYLDKVHAIPPALVFKQREEHPERRVPYGSGQMMVTLHSLHVQVLHADGTHLVVVRERMGDFVEVISTAVGNALL